MDEAHATAEPGARLTGPRRAWRLAATAAVLLTLGWTTVYGTDDDFPLGPMVQYAFRTDPDSFIDSHYVEADTTDGRRITVPLSNRGVGMKRAQIEGQLLKFIADPSMLQQLAEAQERLHPDEPHYTRVYLMRDRLTLRDGRGAGHTIEVLAQWAVVR